MKRWCLCDRLNVVCGWIDQREANDDETKRNATTQAAADFTLLSRSQSVSHSQWDRSIDHSTHHEGDE